MSSPFPACGIFRLSVRGFGANLQPFPINYRICFSCPMEVNGGWEPTTSEWPACTKIELRMYSTRPMYFEYEVNS